MGLGLRLGLGGACCIGLGYLDWLIFKGGLDCSWLVCLVNLGLTRTIRVESEKLRVESAKSLKYIQGPILANL